MLERFEIFMRRLRNCFNRSQLLVRFFGLSRATAAQDPKGLVLIQIDALPRTQLEKALRAGRMPFLKNLLDKQHYQLHTHYSGMPCGTPASQAELFYGVKSAVPGFGFYESASKRVFAMFNPGDAAEIERRLKEQGKPLLTGGSAYSNIFSGGAEESHFCISTIGFREFVKISHLLKSLLLPILYFPSLLRTVVFLGVEAVLAVVDCVRGLIKGRDLWRELIFVPSRVAMCVLLRELVVAGAKLDINRGLSVIHLNLMGYHEQSHRRGATSRFAHWTLKGIDDAIKRVWISAHRDSFREYDVWIYSDHGQTDTIPSQKQFDKSIHQSVADAFEEFRFLSPFDSHRKSVGFLARAGLRRPEFFAKLFPSTLESDPDAPIITARGPLGQIYLKNELSPEQMESFAKHLITDAQVPTVLVPRKEPREKIIDVWTKEGHFELPEQADRVFDSRVPFFREMVQDFLDMCRSDNAGDLFISGRDIENNRYYSFVIENGSHGGIAAVEAEGFALLPKKMPLPCLEKGYLRPLDLRNNALAFLEAIGRPSSQTAKRMTPKTDALRIMTYNVHGCVGMDGILSPGRIARVIAQYHPDIVALQELDVGRRRSGWEDQAMRIANILNMEHYFNASMRVAEESFGDAILSIYPMQLMRKDALVQLQKLSFLETRGALWVQIEFDSRPIQIINTHLGLHAGERFNHAEELLGDTWVSHPKCRGPVVLCGDFNAMPGSKTFKCLNSQLKSTQACLSRKQYQRTWSGRYPVVCLDHVFVGDDIQVVGCEVGDSFLARLASDHRPVIVDVRLPC